MNNPKSLGLFWVYVCLRVFVYWGYAAAGLWLLVIFSAIYLDTGVPV